MSTHNISFYEEMTKLIFQLSSNIIKYAPLISLLLSSVNSLFCKNLVFTDIHEVPCSQIQPSLDITVQIIIMYCKAIDKKS